MQFSLTRFIVPVTFYYYTHARLCQNYRSWFSLINVFRPPKPKALLSRHSLRCIVKSFFLSCTSTAGRDALHEFVKAQPKNVLTPENTYNKKKKNDLTESLGNDCKT